MRLLYQASRDGFKKDDFFHLCANKGATLTLVKVSQRESSGAWMSSIAPFEHR
jgi:hypothetical protein